MNIEKLKRYSDARSEHDIEKIMPHTPEDCLFMTGGGPQLYGAQDQGHSAVRKRFEGVWKEFPHLKFINTRHFFEGNRGFSEWTFVATSSAENRLEIDGCDLFTFRRTKISIKNTFLNNRK